MHLLSNQRGSVIVWVTLMAVLLLVMVGLGLDTGQLTYVRNQGQAAVDAAALAAVSALPSKTPDQVVARAAGFNSVNDYVESPTNKIGSSHVSYVKYDYTTNQITNYAEPIATANGVRVALEGVANSITTPVFLTPLMNLFGMSTSGTKDINVSAVATIISKPAIPIALWSNGCTQNGVEYNVQIKMQHPDQNSTGENACWTTFLDCSSGAPDIKAEFQTAGSCSGNPIDGAIEIGTLICQNRGQVTSVLQSAEQFFTDPDHAGRWWIVPVLSVEGIVIRKTRRRSPTGLKSTRYHLKHKAIQNTSRPR
ncbi:MAG: pilus assembly protein TadG-related protein [Candidatus Binatia bacterium]